MSTTPKYYIVEASALPEVFLKVAEAKRLLSTGEASTVNEATRMTDISRSAFYKYRDAVLPFQNMMTGRIITFQLLLQDEQGILSSILTTFAEKKANIITINSIVHQRLRHRHHLRRDYGSDRSAGGAAAYAASVPRCDQGRGSGRLICPVCCRPVPDGSFFRSMYFCHVKGILFLREP